MKLYIYNNENQVIAIAEGESNDECESKAQPYANDYGASYSDAGLWVNDEESLKI